jgi:hypothetical protein
VAVSQLLTRRWIGLGRLFALDVRMRIRQTRAMAETDKVRRYLLGRLRKLGADADGETGEAHPLRAIREVLARRPADEIILATAPHRMTRLLAMDLQHGVHRSFGLPVTVLGIAPTES